MLWGRKLSMQLLNIQMPSYSRIQWASKKIKEEWEPRFLKAKRVFHELEVLSVEHGLRPCATVYIRPRDMIEKLGKYADKGIVALPLIQSEISSTFSHTIRPAGEQSNYEWYYVLSKSIEQAREFQQAFLRKDDEKIGELLGFPSCCREFFQTEFVQNKYSDPIWQQALNASPELIHHKGEHIIRLKDNQAIHHSMLRYLNLRLTPHMPCSFDCKESHEMAHQWLGLAKSLEIEGTDDLIQFLNMPLEWNALKAIAYIQSPLFKVEAATVPCYPKYTVQKEGAIFPEEAPQGLRFPWTERWKFHGSKINLPDHLVK